MPMTPNEAEARITDLTPRGKVAYNAQAGANVVSESSSRESARTAFTLKLGPLKIPFLCFMFYGTAYASFYLPLKFAQEPAVAQVLEHSGLASADEETLLGYVEAHWDAVGCWIPEVTDREQERISLEYFRRVRLRDGDAEAYLTKARAQLEVDRLGDPRRIVDATIRELGRKGTKKSLLPLLNRSRMEEREWVRWKALASVQEILPRVDPTQLEREIMIHISADLIAPLLRDLDADVADLWAWTLWERLYDSYDSAVFRSHVRLRTRIWLAKAFAANHPDAAAEVFREGLQSQDAAIRSATEMIIRSGIGGSLPYNVSTEQLAKSFLSREWHSTTPLWDTLPLPLDRPLLRKLVGGRTDLIWLSSNARVARSEDDVWPLIRESLTNGNFYSRVGAFFPMEYGLSGRDGVLHSRIQSLCSTPIIASHGGLWAINGHNRIAEFQAYGSKLWECPIKDDYRQIVPISGGRVVLLGSRYIESRNRRGDLLWKTPLKSLGDPRYIVPIDDDRFLVSCGTSVGWLSRDGKYDPVLAGFKSSGWIRYHPTEPWIILEGSDSSAVIFDPKTKKELGRVDLDDGWGKGKSRFPFPRTYFPE